MPVYKNSTRAERNEINTQTEAQTEPDRIGAATRSDGLQAQNGFANVAHRPPRPVNRDTQRADRRVATDKGFKQFA